MSVQNIQIPVIHCTKVYKNEEIPTQRDLVELEYLNKIDLIQIEDIEVIEEKKDLHLSLDLKTFFIDVYEILKTLFGTIKNAIVLLLEFTNSLFLTEIKRMRQKRKLENLNEGQFYNSTNNRKKTIIINQKVIINEK